MLNKHVRCHVRKRHWYRFIVLSVFLFGSVGCAHTPVQKTQSKLVQNLKQAQLSIKNRQFTKAKSQLEHAIVVAPKAKEDPIYWSYRAQVALGLKAYKTAVLAGERAWHLAPTSLSAANNYLVLLCLAAQKSDSSAESIMLHKQAAFVFLQALQNARANDVGLIELRANAKHCHIKG